MKIIRNYLVLISVFAITAAYSQQKPIASKITEATVFMRGAELAHTASAQLVKGVNQITIEGLSPGIDRNSIKIKIDGSVVVSAYEYSVDYLSGESRSNNERLKRLKDSIDICRLNLDLLAVKIKVNSGMQGYLETGIDKNVSGSESGLGIEELKKTIDYYKSKSEEILNGERALQKQDRQVREELSRMQKQYYQESGQDNKTSGVLKLNLSAPVSGTFPMTITYYTEAASWTPFYDINATSTDAPIRIWAKSKVSQNTGLDWNNVKLTLSTALPGGGKVAPLFTAWFLRNQTFERADNSSILPSVGMQNAFSYEKAVQLDDAVGRGQSDKAPNAVRGGSKPVKPIIVIDGVVCSQKQLDNIDPNMIKDISELHGESATSLYGQQAANGVIVVTLRNSIDDFITQQENALNVTYNIDLPYSIPGNGKAQNIDLMTKEAVAEYKYYCAPRLDPTTYLIAEIAGWEKLGLLSGKANVTYDGTYLGETFIDASSTHAKLTLTLGDDKRVSVTRELMREFSNSKIIGNSIERSYSYKLTVRNNQTKPIRMVLKDQYPISTDNRIVVEFRTKETTPWTANKEQTGVVTWEEEFSAGETKTYMFHYNVRYPKEMNLNL